MPIQGAGQGWPSGTSALSRAQEILVTKFGYDRAVAGQIITGIRFVPNTKEAQDREIAIRQALTEEVR